MGNIPVGLCRQWSLYFNTFFGHSGDLKLKERALNENIHPHMKEVSGACQRSSRRSFPNMKIQKWAGCSSKHRDPRHEQVFKTCQLDPHHLYHSLPSSPGYKNGHLDSTGLACNVPLALGPRFGSALAASPELLEAEAREIREKTWEISGAEYQGICLRSMV